MIILVTNPRFKLIKTQRRYRHRPLIERRKILRIKGAPRGPRLRLGPLGARLFEGSFTRIKGRLASLGPLGAGYLKGALMLNFHLAMSWNNKAARSAEKF